MKTSLTKVFLIVMSILVASVFILAGCKEEATSTEEAVAEEAVAEEAVAEEAVEEVTEEKATLTFWNHPTAGDTVWEADYFERTIAAFEEENPNIDINLEWVPWDGFWAKLVGAIEAGEPPDLHHAGEFHMLAFIPDGEILPIDDVVAELGGPEAFSPLFSSYQYDGHTWGLPYLEGGYIFFYNKEILAEAGYTEPPKDWDEMLEIAQAVTNQDEEVYGIGVDYSAGNGAQQVFGGYRVAADGWMLSEDEVVIYDNPGNVEALRFYTDLGLKYDVVPPGSTAITAYETTATPLLTMFGNEQLAMISYWQLGADQLASQFPDVWEKTGVAIFPAGPSGHSGAMIAANSIYIHSKTKYPEAAKTFLKYFFRPEVYGEWIAGSGWIPGLNAAWDYQPEAEWRDVIREQMKTGSRGYDPFGGHPKIGAAYESFIDAEAVQDVVVNGMTPEEAVKKAQKAYEEIFYGE